MKTIYLTTRIAVLSILLLITLYSLNTYAQKSWVFGAKAGINFADLFGDTYSGTTFKPGIVIGAFAEMPFSDKWTFAGELLYSQEGARNYNYDFSTLSDVIYDQKLRYNYLNIPLLAKFNISNKWNVHAGPQIGILLCAKEIRKIKSGTPATSDNSEVTRNIKGRLKPVYISFFIGGEYRINEKMAVEARFYSSFFDNVKKNAGDSEGTYPLIFQFTYAYKFFRLPK